MKLGHGAEAIVLKHGKHAIKERVAKAYRHPILDVQLRKSRTRREANLLRKLHALGFPVPQFIDSDDSKMTLTMEYVKAPKVRDVKLLPLCVEIGKNVGLLHKHDIVHGDLTTSNMLRSDVVVFIDFGLSFVSTKAEDKAVDLNLLHQALTSAHNEVSAQAWTKMMTGYKQGNPNWKEVLTQLEKVKKRGRNKA